MGLKCLLGHEFGERVAERERHEDGDEVVIVDRTVETCERCGKRRVITENTEVRSAEQPDDTGSDQRDGRSSSPGGEAPTAVIDRASAGDDGVRVDEEPTGAFVDEAESEFDDHDPAEEDAVILGEEDETAKGGSEPAKGADESTATEDDQSAMETDGPSDTRVEAVADEPETEILGDDFGTEQPAGDTDGSEAESPAPADGGVEGTGEWPRTPESAGGSDDAGAAFVTPEKRTVDRDAATTFRCTNCETTHPAAETSLRAGDVCPDCRKGYLAERVVE
jgi:DNA-directed RNA polymerase subunit M/transcription elongation factor TFIIS